MGARAWRTARPPAIAEAAEHPGLVCTALRAPARTPRLQLRADECAADRPARTSCESQLAECRGRRASQRDPWPLDAGIESPDSWTRRIHDAWGACHLPAELMVVDCSEYPCVAGLRVEGSAMDGAAVDSKDTVERALRQCPGLLGAFDWSSGDPALARAIRIVDETSVRCPPDGRRESMLVLSVLAPGSPLLSPHDDGFDELLEGMRKSFRRTADLTAIWPCPPRP